MNIENHHKPQRTVYTADAIEWLKTNSPIPGASVITSLPDFSEFPGLTLAEWKNWFRNTAELVLRSTPQDGVTVFFQSDIKFEGEWVDKGYLVTRAAEEVQSSMLFHKIFCRATPGSTTYGKPAYSHLIAFSQSVRPDVSRSTPDVIPDLGEKTWVRGMGFSACRIAVEFIRKETQSHTILNPFCGLGSVLAVSNLNGFDAIGIEKSTKRAEQARSLQVTSHGEWVGLS